MKGAVYGVLSINSITGGEVEKTDCIGGEAYFAYNALKRCGCNAKIISGISRDFYEFGADWLIENHICRDSLLVRTDYCIKNLIDSDGTIQSAYGDGFTKFNEMIQRMFVTHMEPYVKDIDFLYFSDMLDVTNAQKLEELKMKFGFQVMWQIPKVNNEHEKKLVIRNIECAEVLSICTDNAFPLFGCSDEKEVINHLAEWGRPVYFLTNEGDSCLIAGHTVYQIYGNGRYQMSKESKRIAFETTASAVIIWALVSGYEYPEALCMADAMACFNVFHRDFPDMRNERLSADIQQEIKYLMQQMTTYAV